MGILAGETQVPWECFVRGAPDESYGAHLCVHGSDLCRGSVRFVYRNLV
jgi:hypothetical protein